MKILYLTELLTSGGTAKHLSELLPKLLDRGIEPTVWSRGELGKYAKSLIDAGVRLTRDGSLFETLLKAKKNSEYDLVHSYLYGPHLADALFSRVLGLRYIKSTRNEGHWFTKSLSVQFRVWLRSRIVSHHLTNSDGVKRYLVEKEKVIPGSIEVVRNGLVDKKADIKKISRESQGIKHDAFVLVTLSWLKKHKKIDFLIASMPSIVRKCHRAVLLIIGDGPEAERLQNMARSLGVESSCFFCGRQEDPLPFLELADVMVSASPNEGLSNAFIEAQMMGLPCVLTRQAAGNKEIVNHSKNGYLYNSEDEKYFAECILNLYSNNHKLEDFKKESRNHFLSEFEIDRQVDRFVNYYQSILTWNV